MGQIQKSGTREGKIPLFFRRCRLRLAERRLKINTLYEHKKKSDVVNVSLFRLFIRRNYIHGVYVVL